MSIDWGHGIRFAGRTVTPSTATPLRLLDGPRPFFIQNYRFARKKVKKILKIMKILS
jgi:hypothetical protein